MMGKFFRARGIRLVGWLALTIPVGAQSGWSLQNAGVAELLNAVVHDGTQFIAVGEAGALTRSVDGFTWTVTPDAFSGGLRGLVYDGTQFVGCGQTEALFAQVVTSPDGITWTSSTVAGQSGILLSGLATNYAGTFVACGSGGRIYNARDPGIWTSYLTLPGAPLMQAVAYGAGRFVTVGAEGTIAYSANATSWTPATSGTTEFLSGITYGNGRWVAVGSAGTILTSTNLDTWTPRTSGTTEFLFAAAYEGGYYLALGAAGTLLTSTNAVSWTPRVTGFGERLAGVTEANGLFVAVGEPTASIGSAVALVSISTPPQGFRWSTATRQVPESAGAFELTINRTGSTQGAVQVRYFLHSGTATVGVDLPDTSPLIDFADGQASKTISIPLSSDTLFESMEILTVELRTVTPGWATLQPSSVVVTLRDAQDSDNDALPDAWEMTYFHNLAVLPGADADSDGNSNLVEYTDGTIPIDATSALYSLGLAVTGTGTLTPSPLFAKYTRGTEVTVTATPSPGWTFQGWTGPVTGGAVGKVSMTANVAVSAHFSLSLAGALDGAGFTWTTVGPGQPWSGETTTTHDGTDAAQSGATPSGQSTSVSASVTGPGRLTFWWKCSCRSNSDFLRCAVDGVEKASRTGVQDWVNTPVTIPSGTHTVAWTYTRGATGPFGNDAAWLDQVAFENSFESWRSAQFSVAELSDLGFSGADADPDLDRLSNYLEYAFDTLPKTPAPTPSSLPVLVTVQVSGAPHHALQFTRPASRVNRVSYQASWSAGLVNWTPFGSEAIISESAGVQTVRIVDPLPADGAPWRFYRVLVSERVPQ